ncbi:hypothetical protein L6R52_42485, partial [Myxococcota bacterium]|nr:hypothetical protein [Myxococcota bacterium]
LSAGAGALVDGVVDLTFRELGPEGPRWIVVDFKTDAELDLRRAHYDVQLGLYVQAIEAATGERAEAVLLAV